MKEKHNKEEGTKRGKGIKRLKKIENGREWRKGGTKGEKKGNKEDTKEENKKEGRQEDKVTLLVSNP